MVGVDITSLNVPKIAEDLELKEGDEFLEHNILTLLNAGYSHLQAAYIAQWVDKGGSNFEEPPVTRQLDENPHIPESLVEIEQDMQAGLTKKLATPFTATPNLLIPEGEIQESALTPVTIGPEMGVMEAPSK
jgi:hypothetical protein